MVTIYDIAKKANVSPNTVSRVLNGKAVYIRPTFSKRAEKIRTMADSMGYLPNVTAQSMKNGKHSSICLLTSPQRWSSTLANDALFSLQDEIANRKCSLVLNTLSEGDDKANQNLPRIFKENCVDGVLVNITHRIPDWLEPMLNNMGVPFIWLGSKQKVDCVYHDDMGAAEKLTKKLLQAGHEQIAYVDLAMPENSDPRKWHFSNIDRMYGYQQAMTDAGEKPKIIRPATFLESKNKVSFLIEKLFTKDMPTAVITYDLDFIGNAVLFAAARKGIEIPADMSFVTFNPNFEPCLNDLNIAHYAISPKFSEAAINMLNTKISNGNKPAQPINLPLEFIEGDTIAQLKPRRNVNNPQGKS